MNAHITQQYTKLLYSLKHVATFHVLLNVYMDHVTQSILVHCKATKL